MICPNKNTPEWKAISNAHPRLAYYLWNKYEGDIPLYYTQPVAKEGVSELLESDTELANAVYESLGFKQIDAEATARIKKAEEDLRQIHKIGIDTEYEDVVKSQDKNRFHFLDTNNFKNTNQKSVNIEHIHVPEQYRNKGYGLSLYIVRGEELLKEGKYLISYDQHSPEAEIVWQRLLQLGLATQSGEYGTYQYVGLQDQITPQQRQQAQQLYSQYLDSIFPESKVEDIVYHGVVGGKTSYDNILKNGFDFKSQRNWDDEKSKFKKGDNTGMFFSNYATASFYGEDVEVKLNEEGEYKQVTYKNVIPAVLNIKYLDSSQETASDTAAAFYKENKDKQAIGMLGPEGGSEGESLNYVVFEPEQIHILGNKQDIAGFKQFVRNLVPMTLTDMSNLDNTEFEVIKCRED